MTVAEPLLTVVGQAGVTRVSLLVFDAAGRTENWELKTENFKLAGGGAVLVGGKKSLR